MSSGGVFANVGTKDGPRSSGGLGFVGQQVRHSQGSQRPNMGVDQLKAADRRHDTDPGIRKVPI